MKQDGSLDVTDIKKLIDDNLMSWEKSELANSLITHEEVLRECSIEEVMRFTPFYIAEEVPDGMKIEKGCIPTYDIPINSAEVIKLRETEEG